MESSTRPQQPPPSAFGPHMHQAFRAPQAENPKPPAASSVEEPTREAVDVNNGLAMHQVGSGESTHRHRPPTPIERPTSREAAAIVATHSPRSAQVTSGASHISSYLQGSVAGDAGDDEHLDPASSGHRLPGHRRRSPMASPSVADRLASPNLHFGSYYFKDLRAVTKLTLRNSFMTLTSQVQAGALAKFGAPP